MKRNGKDVCISCYQKLNNGKRKPIINIVVDDFYKGKVPEYTEFIQLGSRLYFIASKEGVGIKCQQYSGAQFTYTIGRQETVTNIQGHEGNYKLQRDDDLEAYYIDFDSKLEVTVQDVYSAERRKRMKRTKVNSVAKPKPKVEPKEVKVEPEPIEDQLPDENLIVIKSLITTLRDSIDEKRINSAKATLQVLNTYIKKL